jgi:tRNA A-37 threonylcarbamoyl transferase component Bud32
MTARTKLKSTLVQQFGPERLSSTLTPLHLGRVTSPDGTFDEVRDSLPLDGDIVGGQYRLVRRLGEGMFGRVYVAERTDVPEHRVALKVIDRAMYGGRNPERELVMLAAATHPNIVQLKDHGITDDYVWLTMPLYEGETLAERLERGPLSLREAYDVFLPITRGVQALHARELRHQDIKPENIFLADFEGRPHPVLLDLGVAVERNAAFVAGTALYAAPEQLAALGGVPGSSTLSARMDTYCLATTLLVALVGEDNLPGSDARSPFDIANAFEEREHNPLRGNTLPDLCGEPRRLLSDAFSRWLTPDPDDRPTAGEMATQLEVLLEQERDVQRGIERGVAQRKASLRRVRIALGALLLVGAGATAFGFSKRETLRIAAELDRVKAAGVVSFDKLDTCIAAHEIGQREIVSCETDRKADTAEQARAVLSLRNTSEHNESRFTLRVAAAAVKLRSCEDGAERTKDEHTETLRENESKLSQIHTTLGETRRKLNASRTAHKAMKKTHTSALASQTACRADLASCIEDRETCLGPPAALPAAVGPAPKTPPASPAKEAPPATGNAPDNKGAASAPRQ